MLRVSILGGAGYAGGELIRLVLGHPELELAQVGSASQAGNPLHTTHPNLRGHSSLRFEESSALAPTTMGRLELAAPTGSRSIWRV